MSDKLQEIKEMLGPPDDRIANAYINWVWPALHWLIAEVERLSPTGRIYSCGCVTCICEDEVKCHGCGAKSCGQPGMPAEHTPGAKPMSIPELLKEVERLTKRCEEARKVMDGITSGNWGARDLYSWLEGKP